MKYISTRGTAPILNFADAALAGLARDGGLYIPEYVPALQPQALCYQGLAAEVMAPFIGDDLSADELKSIIAASYKNFDTPDVAPLKQLSDDFYVMELFHGPTLAFKDVALQFLGNLFDHLLEKRQQRVTIVGATSGDTGSAAIEAFKGKAAADIVILYPHGRVSDVQRKQMTTVDAPNVMNIAIEGSFDDCQDLVKAMFNDHAFRDEMRLSAVNSINWARILAQVVYYFHAARKIGRPLSFCVPTGNFGNIYAGYVAKMAGLDIQKLIVATNENDILHRFFDSGDMAAAGVVPTLSPSMDIQVSSNFERLLFDVRRHNAAAVTRDMTDFRKDGHFSVDGADMALLKKTFASGRKSNAETTDIIRRIYQDHDYIIDPHTAVGIGVAEDWQRQHPGTAIVALATAHPAKFLAAVKAAIGREPPVPKRLAAIMHKKEKYDVLPNDLARVQEAVRRHAAR